MSKMVKSEYLGLLGFGIIIIGVIVPLGMLIPSTILWFIIWYAVWGRKKGVVEYDK